MQSGRKWEVDYLRPFLGGNARIVVKICIELWNADTCEMVFIGVGESNMAKKSYRAKPIPFEDVAMVAAQKILAKIP
jgi:hypothetical protein